ncbi:MAG TPA: ABC transporter ATP-binding protein [Oligoflexus sp.]|uniref:ABC transporter ATP-binding protein n=1 Tax=Oligoflexus sp. TaxID=1971216 RepID=UPI002D801DFD|nr:ABC transporter ATP-binding protein [Oligoflexus sp.]HET9235943.1 ABC transporter ATP-binding protein [Oligoflexus sp.]
MQAHNDPIDHQGDFSAVLALFKHSHGTRGRLFFCIGLVIASAGLLMLSAKLMGHLAELLLQKQPWPLLLGTVASILAIESVNIFIYYHGRVGIAYVTNRVAFQIREALFRKLNQLPMAYYDQQPLGRTITRLTADVEGIESFFSNTLPRVLTALITVVSVLIAMLLTDFKIGFYICLSSLPAIIFTVLMRKPVRFWLRDYKKRSAAINAQLAELINGLPVIKVFGLEKWSQKVFQQSSEDMLNSAFSLMNWNTFIRPAAAFLCSMPIVIILWWGGHMALDQQISIGLLVAFIRYAERYFRPIMQLSFELHLIQDAIASSERVSKMLDETEESKILGPSGGHKASVQGSVEFHDVWMEYLKDQPVLRGVDFKVKAGTSVGLVGKTGSGKSTTVHLIPQLYPIQKGEIRIDGVSLEAWDRTILREQIGIVSQDVVIFQGTLRENLLVTIPEEAQPDDETVLKACRRTGLSLVMDKLAAGLDTILQDGGSNLSMGERQLIAFTRMLLRNPAILILDEATANVDEPCEALIQKAILEVLKGRTCFIIAHRLSTIQHCDNILVFQDGRIMEQGRHDQLVERQGHYSQLVKRQIAHEYI